MNRINNELDRLTFCLKDDFASLTSDWSCDRGILVPACKHPGCRVHLFERLSGPGSPTHAPSAGQLPGMLGQNVDASADIAS